MVMLFEVIIQNTVLLNKKRTFFLGLAHDKASAAVGTRASAHLYNLVEKQNLLVPCLPLLISLLENNPWYLISLSKANCYY